NYVQQALDEAKALKPVSVPITRSYGCSVKY
ncbi:MAG: thioredoxin family protein, partial [Candidatus Riflebacteria bacterium]|nr:thioredoxin family protein [Candidatus Riflebacteria bacterium]